MHPADIPKHTKGGPCKEVDQPELLSNTVITDLQKILENLDIFYFYLESNFICSLLNGS